MLLIFSKRCGSRGLLPPPLELLMTRKVARSNRTTYHAVMMKGGGKVKKRGGLQSKSHEGHSDQAECSSCGKVDIYDGEMGVQFALT